MNLLFDYGGVLVDLTRQRCIDAFAAIGFDIRPFIGTFVQGGFLSKLERGMIDVHGFCDELRSHCTDYKPTDDEIVGAWELYLNGVPDERLDMLLKIRRHYPTYVLSNVNPIHWRLAREHYFRYKGYTIDDFFKKCFLSYELGVEKPSPAIYEAVIKGIGCAPEEILFFDDCEENCEGARRCGLQARLAPANSKWLEYFTPEGIYIPETT